MTIAEGEIFFLGQQVHRAALQRHRGTDPLMFQHVTQVDQRNAINLYFMRLAAFIKTAKMTGEHARIFRDKIAIPDATDIVIEDAIPLIEKDPGAYGVTDAQLAFLKTVVAAINWYNDVAYETSPGNGFAPANENRH